MAIRTVEVSVEFSWPDGDVEKDFEFEVEFIAERGAIIRMDPINSSPPEPEVFDILSITCGKREFTEDEFKLLIMMHEYTADTYEYILEEVRSRVLDALEPDEPDWEDMAYDREMDRADYIHEGYQDPRY